MYRKIKLSERGSDRHFPRACAPADRDVAWLVWIYETEIKGLEIACDPICPLPVGAPGRAGADARIGALWVVADSCGSKSI